MSPPTESRPSGTEPGASGNQYRSTGSLAARGAPTRTRVRDVVVGVWRSVADTVSPVGWMLVTIAVCGLSLGLVFGWLEFVAAGLVSLLLVVLAVPFLFRARAYDVELALERDRIVAGGRLDGVLTVRASGAGVVFPGRIDVPVGEGLLDVAVPLLRRGREHERRIVVPTPHRGIVTIGPARTVRGDPLGIVSREVSWDRVHTVFVHPPTTALPTTAQGLVRDLEGQSSRALVDADISFHALREYQPGDPQRQVHWKSTAKTGTLMVRQFEQTRRSRILIALALAESEYGTDDEFELAVSAAASLAVRALRDARDVDLVVSGEVAPFARRAVRTLRRVPAVTTRTLLDALAGVQRSDGAHGLTDVATLAAESTPDVSLAFVVCGSAVTARTLQSAALAFPPHVGVVAVLCSPEAEPGARRLGDMQVLSIGLLDDLRHLLSRGATS